MPHKSYIIVTQTVVCWKSMIANFVRKFEQTSKLKYIVLREDGNLWACLKNMLVENRLIHNKHNISELKGLFFVFLNELFLITFPKTCALWDCMPRPVWKSSNRALHNQRLLHPSMCESWLSVPPLLFIAPLLSLSLFPSLPLSPTSLKYPSTNQTVHNNHWLLLLWKQEMWHKALLIKGARAI